MKAGAVILLWALGALFAWAFVAGATKNERPGRRKGRRRP